MTDFFHAVEQLKKGLDHMMGATKPETDREHRRLRRLLRDDPDGAMRVQGRLAELAEKTGATGYPTAIPYFDRHGDRMEYAAKRKLGIPVGTGVMEGTCKTLVTQRLKQAGMRWEPEGGQAILTLNALDQSGQFDTAWPVWMDAMRRAA